MCSAPIDAAMRQAVSDGVFPSAELLVGTPKEILYHTHVGECSAKSLFDLASLTKVVCTTTLGMIAVAEGRCKLTDPLSQHLKIPQHPSHEGICLYHLLQHSSGLPAHRKYYEQLPPELLGTPAGADWMVRACAQEPCEAPVGDHVVYSDIGFILLGRVLENIWGESLDRLFAREVATPFGLQSTHFMRPSSPSPFGRGWGEGEAHFIPSQNCPWRGRVICGEPRDENCDAMGGVAGHAGLFGNATDLHQFAKCMIAAHDGSHELLNPSVVQNFLYPTTPAPHMPSKRVLGWDAPEPPNSSAGNYFSEKSIGHLAFTGCSLWIDLEKKRWIILLSNRTYPSTNNEKIRAFRPMIHDLIWSTASPHACIG